MDPQPPWRPHQPHQPYQHYQRYQHYHQQVAYQQRQSSSAPAPAYQTPPLPHTLNLTINCGPVTQYHGSYPPPHPTQPPPYAQAQTHPHYAGALAEHIGSAFAWYPPHPPPSAPPPPTYAPPTYAPSPPTYAPPAPPAPLPTPNAPGHPQAEEIRPDRTRKRSTLEGDVQHAARKKRNIAPRIDALPSQDAPTATETADMEGLAARGQDVMRRLVADLRAQLADELLDQASQHLVSVKIMQQLAEQAEVATPDNSHLRYLSPQRAQRVLEAAGPLAGPLVVKSGMNFRYSSVADMVEKEGRDRKILYAQDPSQPEGHETYSKIATDDAMYRLQHDQQPAFPLNFLDFALSEKLGVVPDFVASLNLLPQISQRLEKYRVDRSRRGTGGVKEPSRAKGPESWSTWAQAGALTRPHVDVDGLGTVLTCAQGTLIIFYLDAPPAHVFSAFSDDPFDLPVSDRWRVAVVESHESFVMDAGTIHAVARLRTSSYTWTLGAHFLRDSQVARTAELCKRQIQNPRLVNEHATQTSRSFLIVLGKHLREEELSGRGQRFGGKEGLDKFWEEFQYIEPRATREWAHTAKLTHYRPQKGDATSKRNAQLSLAVREKSSNSSRPSNKGSAAPSPELRRSSRKTKSSD